MAIKTNLIQLTEAAINGYFLKSDATGNASWAPGGSGAPADASYIVIGLNGTLTNERVLTGTANQIILADAGANGTITLSTPQDIHTAATPSFSTLNLTGATGNTLVVDTSVLVVDATNHRVGIKTSTPGYKLTVAGSGEVDFFGGRFNVNDTTGVISTTSGI